MKKPLSLRNDTRPIPAHAVSEESLLGEIHAGIAELDAGTYIPHEKVAAWLKTWGQPGATKLPPPSK